MIIPDTNLLLYATISGFPQHEVARRWWEKTLSSGESFGLVAPVALGFVRLATSRRLLENPMPPQVATGHVRSWLNRPAAVFLPATTDVLLRALDLLDSVGAAGNLTTDAEIAAHAVGRDAVVATNDADFTRFPGVRTVNPLTP